MRRHWVFIIIIVLGAISLSEFIADYIQLSICSWPKVDGGTPMGESALNAMILADTHLLGPRGHWLDKLYREWHMHRSFQASMTLFMPDIIFVLGDHFDEGDLINHSQFKEHVKRFRRYFKTSPGTPIISAVGNHDVGFHYKMHPFFTKRFERNFNNTSVRLYTINDIHFVFINSMALEMDGCYFCETALHNLNAVNSTLDCLKKGHVCNDASILREHKSYSRPILMQHFPTYRISDKICKEHDAPAINIYRENWDVLSKESTDLLGKLLYPRVAFAGHSHHYCLNINRLGIEEYTAASFSWRNKVNPSFFLATFTKSKYAVSKCDMLRQKTVYYVYFFAVIICTAMIINQLYQHCRLKYRKNL